MKLFVLLTFLCPVLQVFCGSEAKNLYKDRLDRAQLLAESLHTRLDKLEAGIREHVTVLRDNAEKNRNLVLLAWSAWILEDMEPGQGGGLHWLHEPVEFHGDLEESRDEWVVHVNRFVEMGIELETAFLEETNEVFDAHVRSLVREDRIEEAVEARDLFKTHAKSSEIKILRRSVKHLQSYTRPKSRLPNSTANLKLLPKEARVYFNKENPGYQIFLKRVTAISSGHLGVKTTGIRVSGHPEWIGRRGLNVVAYHAGKLIVREHFDTYAKENESEKFANIIENLPYGSLLVVVADQDATRKLTNTARASMHLLGAGASLTKLEYRDAYLLIGMKGMRPGNALELQGPGERTHPDK